jgi:hypothetical protein
MKIHYSQILKKNMLNVFRDVLKNIEINGLQEGHHIYIAFQTDSKKVVIPDWLKEKHPKEMTIIIQYEYWNFKVKNDSFNIGLSFNDINADISVPFDSVISFADPYANFGLKLINEKINKKLSDKKPKRKKSVIKKNKGIDNIIEFQKFKKLR